MFLNKNRVFHITHGIDLRNYEKSTKQGDNNKLIFSYIGYFDDIHKGVGELLKGIHLLLANNKDLDIFFEFSGMGPLESEIKALELKFPNNVKFNGYISNELVSEYYKKADVFLFSSRIEPFPRAIMEALGASLIVICTKTIGSIELLKDKPFAFFLEKLNANNIYERILYVYNIWKNNPTKFYLLKKEAKDFVFKNYSTDIEIEMFKQLIEKIY
ncbi:MAG: glycosyltransferase family 4 protein [Candidatus Lokiarchaeota archaeon]|nr:glycosyltransferase family 4 protein [Candidatus Lokiarchaeota archaeon]